jgi:ElaB/YqjD/DUF883 family membrane-anchored ribosome-binding protein
MSAEPNAQAESPRSPDLDAIAADLASLKRDFASLMSHAKSGAFSGAGTAAQAAQGATEQIRESAAHLYDSATATAEFSAKSIVRQVEEHPLATLLLVFAGGFCASRLMSR